MSKTAEELRNGKLERFGTTLDEDEGGEQVDACISALAHPPVLPVYTGWFPGWLASQPPGEANQGPDFFRQESADTPDCILYLKKKLLLKDRLAAPAIGAEI